MSEIVFLIEDAAGGGYFARALGESIFIRASTLELLREQVLDAVRYHYAEGQGPALIRLHYVRDEVLAAEKNTAQKPQGVLAFARQRR
jgi:hypothetical protein